MIASISKIRIHPIKALDPIDLHSVEIGIHSLKNDRIFAILAEDGRFVNGKRTGRVNQLQTTFDLDKHLVKFTERGKENWETFELKENNLELNSYLEDFFSLKLKLVHNEMGELLDVPQRSSATVISEASLLSLQKGFPELSIEDMRLRFRTNIELSGVEAYWEEGLIDTPQTAVRFQIGDVQMIGMTPRERCNVPPRDPLTGETDKSFVKGMIANREKTLPENSTLNQFGNLYHFAVDIYIPNSEKGKEIKVGDKIKIIETIPLNKA